MAKLTEHRCHVCKRWKIGVCFTPLEWAKDKPRCRMCTKTNNSEQHGRGKIPGRDKWVFVSK